MSGAQPHEQSRSRRPRREIQTQPPTLVPMTDDQREKAVGAVAALLLPAVRKRRIHAANQADPNGNAEF